MSDDGWVIVCEDAGIDEDFELGIGGYVKLEWARNIVSP